MIECQVCQEWYATTDSYAPAVCPHCGSANETPPILQADHDYREYLQQQEELKQERTP